MGKVKKAAKSVGNTLNKGEVKDLKSQGFNAAQIAKLAQRVNNVGDGAQRRISRMSSAPFEERSSYEFNSGYGSDKGFSFESPGESELYDSPFPNDYYNPFNPAAATTTYSFSGDAARLGMSGDFADGLILPDQAQLTAAEQEDVRRNIENQWGLYKDSTLTTLRGQISKELAQLYNMTEIGKSKIAAQSAMDTTREQGMQNFRQTVRDNYGRSLMQMW